MAKIDVKKTELVWLGKYDDQGNLKPVEKPGPYPFQIVEVVNKPRTGKEKPQPALFELWKGDEGNTFEEGWKNKLIWGDNKLVMSSLLEKFAGKINLIYIDPPFATGADFKFKIQIGEGDEEITKEHSIIEEKAYRDTWGMGLDSYLQMMYERLVLMKELLAENGSIYVHLDWHVGNYVKVILDEIFGFENFVNQIIWRKTNSPKAQSVGFGTQHDMIFIYSKHFNLASFKKIYRPLDEKALRPYIYEDQRGKFRLIELEAQGIQRTSGRKTFEFRGRVAPWLYSKETLEKWWKEGLIYKTKYGRYAKKQYLEEIPGLLVSDIWVDEDVSPLQGSSSEFVGFATQKPEGLLKRIVLASSNSGDLVADFFCGSGTTLAVAEKLSRRWIGCDLSRYAIHLTRKRLLEIDKSYDMENENEEYGKKARPFEILNLGKYERQLWQVKTFTNKDEKQALYEYMAFILKLYGAEPISGSLHIHGKKGSALVHVGAVDMPVTINDCVEAIKECKALGQKELHILGWEWEMGLNDAIQVIAEREGVKLKLRLIPMDVLDQEAVRRGDIQFFELAHFKVDIRVKGRKVEVELKDFAIPHTDLISYDVKEKIKKWSDWVDYWAIDFDFRNDTFNNGWTSYRTKKDRTLTLKADHNYERPGKYKIFVKVIDIFGIDSSKIFEVEVK